MVWGEERDTFGPFQIVASAHPSGLLCWASLGDRNVRSRLKRQLALASKRWLELRVHTRQQRAESGTNCPANRDAAADFAYIFLSWSIPSFTWLQAVTLAALLAALSAKDRVFTWCTAVQRPGPPQWNWNVNAYWAAVNTCNPAGPWGGIRKAEEIETTRGGPLSTEVSCLCSWRQLLSSFSTKHHTSTCPPSPTFAPLSSSRQQRLHRRQTRHRYIPPFKALISGDVTCLLCGHVVVVVGLRLQSQCFFLLENRTFPPSSVMKSWNREGRRPRIRSPFSLFQADQWPSSLNIPTAPCLLAPT